MKYCSNCGKKVNENDDFCMNCGKKLKTESTTAKQISKKKCKYCMSEIDLNARVCPNCKRNLIDNSGWIGLVIIVALIVLGIYFYPKLFGDKKEKNVKHDYQKLNPSEVYYDYNNNKANAENKYKDKYYYLTGTVSYIGESWGKYYISMDFIYDKNEYQTIKIDAQFDDKNELLNLNKSDSVTVYCKFDDQNFMLSYVFHLEDCTLKK